MVKRLKKFIHSSVSLHQHQHPHLIQIPNSLTSLDVDLVFIDLDDLAIFTLPKVHDTTIKLDIV